MKQKSCIWIINFPVQILNAVRSKGHVENALFPPFIQVIELKFN